MEENKTAGYRNITLDGIDAFLENNPFLTTSGGLKIPRDRVDITPLGEGVFWSGFFNNSVLYVRVRNEKTSVKTIASLTKDHTFLSVVDEFLRSRNLYVAQANYQSIMQVGGPRLEGYLYKMTYDRYLVDPARKTQETHPEVTALTEKV